MYGNHTTVFPGDMILNLYFKDEGGCSDLPRSKKNTSECVGSLQFNLTNQIHAIED